jgi:hypothetical protein
MPEILRCGNPPSSRKISAIFREVEERRTKNEERKTENGKT